MGIDAQVEVVEKVEPTGRLVGIQINTSAGNFHQSSEGLIYYGSNVHLNYWLGHRLPIILVAHIPETQSTFWVQVQASAIERTSKAWKILIPTENRLNSSSREELSRASEGPPRDQRLSASHSMKKRCAKFISVREFRWSWRIGTTRAWGAARSL